jgi:hypothetical protein
MAVPTAPAAGEPIAEAWGDVVHDMVVGRDIQSGSANIPNMTQADGIVNVVFPRPFAAAPNVITGGAWAGMNVCAQQITATGFQMAGRRMDASNTPITYPGYWIAIGTRA